MIKKLVDIGDLSGVQSPLLPLIYGDFYYKDSENDGVYFQIIDNEPALLFSLKNNCCDVIKLNENYDLSELEAFFLFSRATSVTSDFSLNSKKEKEYNLLKISEFNFNDVKASHSLSLKSKEIDYKIIYDLISECKGGNFPQWYSAFSRKINSFNAKGVYLKENEVGVSAAIAPVIYNRTAVVAGVITKDNYRNLGYATLVLKSLLNEIKTLNIKNIYLWCEDDKRSFYENLGFILDGKIYIREDI